MTAEPTYAELEERVIRLETRIAFQDHTIEELNAVVTKQQTQIDTLIQKVREMAEHVTPSVVAKGADTRPPHY